MNALRQEAPPAASLEYCKLVTLHSSVGYQSFEIVPSCTYAGGFTGVSPDLAPCCDCSRELTEPSNRRYRYPFINCTNCGPRYSIIAKIPYDRANTTMADFVMCAKCEAEYRDTVNRRFHAEPNACPQCGPQLFLAGRASNSGGALAAAVEALARGEVVGLKGLGGFQLAVRRLNYKTEPWSAGSVL